MDPEFEALFAIFGCTLGHRVSRSPHASNVMKFYIHFFFIVVAFQDCVLNTWCVCRSSRISGGLAIVRLGSGWRILPRTTFVLLHSRQCFSDLSFPFHDWGLTLSISVSVYSVMIITPLSNLGCAGESLACVSAPHVLADSTRSRESIPSLQARG